MYHNQKITLVMPAFDEEEAIGKVLEDFLKLGFIDDIIVVDNDSLDRTATVASSFGVKVVKESNRGYGYACRRGMKEAIDSDLIVLTESDGTFKASDTTRLLDYIDDYDLVTGCRLNKDYCLPQAHMHWYIRYGNYILSIFLRILYFYKSDIKDVGCTYMLMRGQALKKILPRLRIKGGDFTPEIFIEAIKSKLRIKQIPLYYLPRIGESKLSRTACDSLVLGIKHLFHILIRRFIN